MKKGVLSVNRLLFVGTPVIFPAPNQHTLDDVDVGDTYEQTNGQSEDQEESQLDNRVLRAASVRSSRQTYFEEGLETT